MHMGERPMDCPPMPIQAPSNTNLRTASAAVMSLGFPWFKILPFRTAEGRGKSLFFSAWLRKAEALEPIQALLFFLGDLPENAGHFREGDLQCRVAKEPLLPFFESGNHFQQAGISRLVSGLQVDLVLLLPEARDRLQDHLGHIFA